MSSLACRRMVSSVLTQWERNCSVRSKLQPWTICFCCIQEAENYWPKFNTNLWTYKFKCITPMAVITLNWSKRSLGKKLTETRQNDWDGKEITVGRQQIRAFMYIFAWQLFASKLFFYFKNLKLKEKIPFNDWHFLLHLVIIYF